jgi:hypothetical protein
MREKLIELLGNIYLPMTCGPDTIGEYCIPHKFKKEIADHLIANGVTVQKWIPVTERLPDSEKCVLVYSQDGGVAEGKYNARFKEWVQFRWNVTELNNVTHWMPLPEPPKGE